MEEQYGQIQLGMQVPSQRPGNQDTEFTVQENSEHKRNGHERESTRFESLHGSDGINSELGDVEHGNHNLNDEQSGQEDSIVDGDTVPSETDWSDLELRYTQAMAKKLEEEKELQEHFEKLQKFYKVWSQMPHAHEEQRATKRLRTRMAYVQGEEAELDNEQAKHDRVVQAFQNALDLL